MRLLAQPVEGGCGKRGFSKRGFSVWIDVHGRPVAVILPAARVLRRELGDELGDAPLRLDYSPRAAESSMRMVRERLSEAVEAVAQNWWVPQSYERLAGVVRRLLAEKKEARARLPILF